MSKVFQRRSYSFVFFAVFCMATTLVYGGKGNSKGKGGGGSDGGSEPPARPVIPYTPVFVPAPEGVSYGVNNANNLGEIGGFYYDLTDSDDRRGFIYNAVTDTLTDANDLINASQLPEGYHIASVVCINDNGTFGGYLRQGAEFANDVHIPYIASQMTGNVAILYHESQPGQTNSVIGLNNRGDAVVWYWDTQSIKQQYVFNPGFDGPIDDAPEYLPATFNSRFESNNQPTAPFDGSPTTLLSRDYSGTPRIYVRGTGEVPIPMAGGYELSQITDLNDYGEMLGYVVTGHTKKGRNSTPITELAVFSETDFQFIEGTTSESTSLQLELLSDDSFNNDGDLFLREARKVDGAWEFAYLINRKNANGVRENVEIDFDLSTVGKRNFSDRFMDTGYPLISGEYYVSDAENGLYVLIPSPD